MSRHPNYRLASTKPLKFRLPTSKTIFHPKTDYTVVDRKISEMNLTQSENKVLECYMSGLGHVETAKTLNVNRTTVWRCRQRLIQKYNKTFRWLKVKKPLWRLDVCLSWYKCGSLRSPQPSTRHEKDNKNKTKNQTESAAARSRPRWTAWGSAPCFPPRIAFSFWFYSCDMYLLNFAFSVGYGSIAPRESQRPQNRCLKHP